MPGVALFHYLIKVYYLKCEVSLKYKTELEEKLTWIILLTRKLSTFINSSVNYRNKWDGFSNYFGEGCAHSFCAIFEKNLVGGYRTDLLGCRKTGLTSYLLRLSINAFI